MVRDKIFARPYGSTEPVLTGGAALRTWMLATSTAWGVFTVTRLVLLAHSWRDADLGIASLALTFLAGAFMDALIAAAAASPFLLLIATLPAHWQRRLPLRLLRPVLFGVFLFSLLFVAVSEVVFWLEFGVRFNFIAVDYLIYTQEVIGNIRESYPVGKIIAAIALAAVALAFALRRALRRAAEAPAAGLRALIPGLLALVLPWIGLNALGPFEVAANAYNNELADNGWRSFVSAVRHNKLDYRRFYATLPDAEAKATLQALMRHPVPARSTRLQPVAAARAAGRPNVLLITVESLSAEYLGTFGNKENLTPNLDRLAGESLLFTRLFAIGTRTVKGLEALSAALPPTPGQSIVKRPDNADLNTLGSVLARQGYTPYFLYGGYGYFDNMNAYFGNNGYRVVDRRDFPEGSVQFENIWGVADEHLFDQAIATLDRETAAGRPVFAHIMTTSNHRPFTYPAGRIDIPSPGSREGGVKYTDYAIGRLIESARRKPWFDNTVFVIVADHCASSAGRTRLPVPRYHIPALIYAPKLIPAARFERLASQIDLAPTLLGLLHLRGGDRFLGQDVFSPDFVERAFISNYQELGYLKNGVLTVLSPKRQVSAFQVSEEKDDARPVPVVPELEREAIAYFQGTADLLDARAYRAK